MTSASDLNAPHQHTGGGGIGASLTGEVYALNFSAWKKPIVRAFLQNCHVHFITAPAKVPEGGRLIVWGSKPIKGKLNKAVKVIRLEDGFLRSVGLGADLISPVSWVADSRSIYYDARQESDLEYLLACYRFDRELLTRAASLRSKIVHAGITKYNLEGHEWQRPESVKNVILVPGQVEDDASIRYGAPEICSNIELLKAVRSQNTGAYIVYKPHPDVVAQLRRKGAKEADAHFFCDEIVIHQPMHQLLKAVDEVHLMTSLTGFEALMRGIKVTCYGHPFYAGWGLTQDVLPIERRQRKLSLDELVAASLILYPSYISHKNGQYITPETCLEELITWSKKSARQEGWRRKIKRLVLRLGDTLRRTLG